MYLQMTMAAENEGIQSQFLTRLTSLPMVHSAWGHATTTYGRVKQSNGLLDYTLTTVEKSMLYANEKAKPIVKTFERQISSADLLACKGLDKLEQTVPIIKEPTERIIQDSKNLYTNTVQNGLNRYKDLRLYGTSKVAAVKEYGTQRASDLLASEYAKLLTASVDGALLLTENFVNVYLPPVDDADQEIGKKEKPILERMSYLSTVVQRRARKMATLKLQELQQATETTVQNINVYSHIDRLRGMPEQVYTSAFWLWEELNKIPEPLTEGRPTLQQHAWTTARQLTHGLVNTYNTTITTAQSLPTHLQKGVSVAYAYTIEIYTTVQKIQPGDLPQLITQARTILKVDNRVADVMQLLNHLPAFQWLLVPAYNENNGNEDLFSEDEIFDQQNYREALAQ